jgi:hypothetical protein
MVVAAGHDCLRDDLEGSIRRFSFSNISTRGKFFFAFNDDAINSLGTELYSFYTMYVP